MRLYRLLLLFVVVLAFVVPGRGPGHWDGEVGHAANWAARREFREGIREIARERREMRRNILASGSRFEARREYREGMREIRRERREMRREMRRAFRYGF